MNDKGNVRSLDAHSPSPLNSLNRAFKKGKISSPCIDLTLESEFTIQKDVLVVYLFGGHYGMMHKIQWMTGIETPSTIHFSAMEGIGDGWLVQLF